MKTLILLLFLLSGCVGDKVLHISGIFKDKYADSDCKIYLSGDERFINYRAVPISKYEIDKSGRVRTGITVSPMKRDYWIRVVCDQNGKEIILHQGPIVITKGRAEYSFGIVGD